MALIFKSTLKKIFTRVSRIEAFGGQAEFSAALNEFKETVSIAEKNVSAPQLDSQAFQIDGIGKEINMILTLSNDEPSLGLMKLSSLLEKEVRTLVFSMGLHQVVKTSSLREMLREISTRHALASSITSSIDQFLKIRNEVVHGKNISRNETVSAIDVGLNLLKAIKAIPHTRNTIKKLNVSLFKDKDCTIKVEGVSGLVLESSDNNGLIHTSVFPTTRSHFKIGRQVAWEWNMDNVWESISYLNDDGKPSGVIMSSAEFIGRNIDDL